MVYPTVAIRMYMYTCHKALMLQRSVQPNVCFVDSRKISLKTTETNQYALKNASFLWRGMITCVPREGNDWCTMMSYILIYIYAESRLNLLVL